MRRTDEAFKAEVFRRCEEYRVRRKKRRKMVAVVCLPILLCGGAVMLAFSGGFGGSSSEIAFDNAKSVECLEAPATAEPLEFMEHSACEEMPESPATDCMDVTGFGQNAGGEMLSIEVISEPASEEHVRVFTDHEKTGAIMDAIEVFFDSENSVIVGDETGQGEGTGYHIFVTTENEVRQYILSNNGLLADDAEGWLVNPEAYQTLLQMIQAEDD